MAKKVTLEDLAAMTADGFSEIGSKVDNGFSENRKDHKEFKKNFSEISFKLTETVHRSEYLDIIQRLRRVEAKLGLSA
jgi:hypothetical protein